MQSQSQFIFVLMFSLNDGETTNMFQMGGICF